MITSEKKVLYEKKTDRVRIEFNDVPRAVAPGARVYLQQSPRRR